MNSLVFILPIFLILFLLFIYVVPVGLWIQALVTIGWRQISLIKLVIMRVRRIPPRQVVHGIKTHLLLVPDSSMAGHFPTLGVDGHLPAKAFDDERMMRPAHRQRVVVGIEAGVRRLTDRDFSTLITRVIVTGQLEQPRFLVLLEDIADDVLNGRDADSAHDDFFAKIHF